MTFPTYLVIIVSICYIIYSLRKMRTGHDDVKGTPVNDNTRADDRVFSEIYKNEYELDTGGLFDNFKSNTTEKRETTKKVLKEKNYRAIAGTPEFTTEKKSETKFSLKSRSEAKRAFIHSEIFNRKYQ